jgi:hypothetical protein
MKTFHVTTGIRTMLALGLAGTSIAILAAVPGGPQAAKPSEPAPPGAALTFRAEQIAADFGIGYAVTTGDVNGDGRTDVVAINATDLVWFEAPSWQKHVILTGATPRDNVSLALHDIDRDGRLDVALGASWQPTNTTSGGTLHWVRQGAPGAAWTLHYINEEPTLHRIRWADVDGDKTQELVVTPLHGRGTKGPDWQGPGARVLVFRPPANPARDPWLSEVADDTLHILHNFLPANLDADAADELLTASREGVNILERRLGKGEAGWSRTLIGEGSPGETKLTRGGRHDRDRRTVARQVGRHLRRAAGHVGADGHRIRDHRRPRARLGGLRRRRQRRTGSRMARSETWGCGLHCRPRGRPQVEGDDR